MARLSFALPILARCERPSAASVSAWRLQPGRLAQGPDEKCGVAGRTAGIGLVMSSILPDGRPSVGKGVPSPRIKKHSGRVKNKNWVGRLGGDLIERFDNPINHIFDQGLVVAFGCYTND